MDDIIETKGNEEEKKDSPSHQKPLFTKIDFEARIASDVENPENIKKGDRVCIAQDAIMREVTSIKNGKANLRWKWGPKQTWKRDTVSLKLLTRICPPLGPMGGFSTIIN